MAHSIGKFAVVIFFTNGDKEFLVGESEGYLWTTKNSDAAARFMTRSGAESYAYKYMNLPDYDGRSVDEVRSCELNNW